MKKVTTANGDYLVYFHNRVQHIYEECSPIGYAQQFQVWLILIIQFNINKQFYLTIKYRYYHSVRVDLEVLAMKGYSILSKALELEPHPQIG